MNKKEKFVMFVYLNAIARDITHSTAESEHIAHGAAKIPEQRIPLNPLNAAQVYVAVFSRNATPFRWMLGPYDGGQRRKRTFNTEGGCRSQHRRP